VLKPAANPSTRWLGLPGLAISIMLTWLAGAPVASAQATTVLSGTYRESGTRTDCNSSGNPNPWSQTGTITITVSPSFGSLASGGPVSGTFTFSGTDMGCNVQPVSGQGTVTGVVSAGGQVTLILTEPVAGCSITGQGDVDEVSGAIPAACLDHPGSGSFDVTGRISPSGGSGGSTCVSFPSGFVPFSSISYVTAANFAGDHLVVGVPAPGVFNTLSTIPLPAFANQTFCDSQVQLAPQQVYPGVYVPTADESGGNFGAFNGLLVNPSTNQPYPNGVIPSGQLNAVFAWRIGAAQTASAVKGWAPTGSMTAPRGSQDSLLLPSGKVLVVGYDSCDIYDPTTGSFSSTANTIFGHGTSPTATLLNNGQVLIVGGTGTPAAAELYDPVSGQFTATGKPVQGHGFFHTATLLNDGRVLLVGGLTIPGGQSSTNVNAGAELYDPSTGTFKKAGAMSINRLAHSATLLPDGRVLIAAGQDLPYPNNTVAYDSAEIFDPATGGFSLTGRMTRGRTELVAALLANGKVLIAAGTGDNSAELFDPKSGTFSPTGPRSLSSFDPRAQLLSNGQVLIEGGQASVGTTNAAELYNPSTGLFSLASPMSTQRAFHTGNVLLDGRVLIAGGNTICCQVSLVSAELYTPVTEGLITSQTGLTFRVAAGSATPAPQTVAVLSNTATIPWTISTHTYQGGSWLIVTSASGNSVPGATPVTLTIGANPTGLAAQDYYGAVTLTPTDGIHPPVSIAIVLSIVPPGKAAPPAVTPGGLLFLGAPGTTLPTQSFTISNLTSTPITFSAAGSNTPKWFSFTPPSGATINGGQSATVTVTPNITGLTAGVYNGTIKLTFGDGSTQTVQLLLVLSATAGSFNVPQFRPKATTTCTPSKLLPVFTTIGTGFNAPAAWPAPIVVDVVDDCGNAFNNGSVIVSFTDGDPPINLLSTGKGAWAGTWVPQHNASAFAVRADAQALPLTGSVQVTGAVLSNPTVPVVSAGGVVSSGDFGSAPAVGLLVSIFGSGLADGPASAGLPLPPQLGSTSVFLSGGASPLPLLYAADGIINVQIPYDAAVNATQQVVVQHGNAISVPTPIAIFTASPSVLSTSGTGSGQGHVYVIGAGGVETLADQNAPATAGNPVVIYCVGLGAVSPSIAAGAITPPAYFNAVAPVTVTFGNQTVAAGFAGLTPGLAGLYQLNVNVPPGVTPGNQVPVTISVGGKSSSGSIYMAIR
jgi:uncharacterized protein (TIGR03437 family)